MLRFVFCESSVMSWYSGVLNRTNVFVLVCVVGFVFMIFPVL